MPQHILARTGQRRGFAILSEENALKFRAEQREIQRRNYMQQRLTDLARDFQGFQGEARKDKLRELQALLMEILEIEHLSQFRPTKPVRAIVPAAGMSSRMTKAYSGPKVLYPVAGEPILFHVLGVLSAYDNKPVVIARPGQRYREIEGRPGEWEVVDRDTPDDGTYEEIRDTIASAGLDIDVRFVAQDVPRGDGHAVLQAEELLASEDFDGHVIVALGDMAVLNPETVLTMLMFKEAADKLGMDVPFIVGTNVTRVTAEEKIYAPVIRDPEGRPIGSEKGLELEIGQIRDDDVGVFVGNAKDIFRALNAFPSIQQDDREWYVNPLNGRPNKKGEMNLVQIIAMFAQEGREVVALPIARRIEFQGVNTEREAGLASGYRQEMQREAIERISQAEDADELADILVVTKLTQDIAQAVLDRVNELHAGDREHAQLVLADINERVNLTGVRALEGKGLTSALPPTTPADASSFSKAKVATAVATFVTAILAFPVEASSTLKVPEVALQASPDTPMILLQIAGLIFLAVAGKIMMRWLKQSRPRAPPIIQQLKASTSFGFEFNEDVYQTLCRLIDRCAESVRAFEYNEFGALLFEKEGRIVVVSNQEDWKGNIDISEAGYKTIGRYLEQGYMLLGVFHTHPEHVPLGHSI